jgi:hypothetical protein
MHAPCGYCASPVFKREHFYWKSLNRFDFRTPALHFLIPATPKLKFLAPASFRYSAVPSDNDSRIQKTCSAGWNGVSYTVTGSTVRSSEGLQNCAPVAKFGSLAADFFAIKTQSWPMKSGALTTLWG